jgi:hypothetical protein
MIRARWWWSTFVACALGCVFGCGGRTGLPYGDFVSSDATTEASTDADATRDTDVDTTPDTRDTSIDAIDTNDAFDVCECTPGDVEDTSVGCPTGETHRLRCDASCTWIEETPCGLHGWFPISAPKFTFEPRSRHGAVWTGTEMIVFGGNLDPEYPTIPDWTEAAAYDPSTDAWRALPPSPFHPPAKPWSHFGWNPATVWTGSSLVAVGQVSAGGSVMAELPFTPWGDWRTITDFPNPEIWSAEAVASPLTHEVIFFGGLHAPSATAQGWAWNVTTRAWRTLAPSPLSPRTHSTAVMVVGTMVVFGGESRAGAPLSDGAAYDPKSDTWTLIASPPVGSAIPPPVDGGLGPPGAWWQRAVAFELPPTAIFFGGSVAPSPYFEARVWSGGGAWDVTSASWSTIPPFDAIDPQPARSRGGAWSTDTRLFVWGGLASPGDTASEGDAHPTDTGASFDRTTGTWSAMLPRGPSPRFDFSTVWTGTEAIVWGGEDRDGVKLGDGMAYRP